MKKSILNMRKTEIVKNPELLLKFLQKNGMPNLEGIVLKEKLSHHHFQNKESGLLDYIFIENQTEKRVCGFFSSKKKFQGLMNKKIFLYKLKEYGFNKDAIRIPEIIDFYSKINLLLRERIEGETILQIMQDKKPLNKAVQGASQWAFRLHSLKPEKKFFTSMFKMNKKNFPFYLKQIKENYPEKLKQIKETLSLIQKTVKTCENNRLFHGDFQPQNIIHNKGITTGFDFDASGIGDPMSDIGNFLLQFDYRAYTLFPEKKIIKLKEVFLNSYEGRIDEKRVNIYQAKYAIQRAIFLMGALKENRSKALRETIENLLQKAENSIEKKEIDLTIYPYTHNIADVITLKKKLRS